jgi:hypothetical protein
VVIPFGLVVSAGRVAIACSGNQELRLMTDKVNRIIRRT